MLDSASVIAFVATTDPDRSREFYGSVLGLEVRSEESHALVFGLHEAMLRIAILPEHAPPPFTVLGWRVDDIVAVVTKLERRGVLFEHFDGMPQDQRGICTFPTGDRVAWFKDPDGNMLSVTQPTSIV